MPRAIPSPSAMTTWKKSDLSIFGTTFLAWLAFPFERGLIGLTADAAIVLDGAVGARNRLLAPPCCCPAALTRLPASISATRHFGPGPATEAALPTIR